MDEVPIPFEFLDGYTYHIYGEKTITGKTDRSRWGKWQATLILYIFADGIPRISPKLIFHSKPDGLIRSKESHLYHPGVTVEFNDTVYNNGDLFNKWIDEELAISLTGDGLLIMDYAAFYKTELALLKLRGHCILPALIPGGCTSLLQPLDVSINKPFKEWLREVLNEVLDQCETQGIDTKTASSRRVITTKIVAAAWERL